MAKSRNNLLGVGGQRKRMSRAEVADNGPTRNADRRTAAEQKEELLRKMRERAAAQEDDSEATTPDTQQD
ncbi:DUF6243 family protein [Streptomyces sp. ISL-100]|uniref:DUF6243 family protein n=1 Tax=Streptomyces sp. ISL-100 TaxID=2819173 RepID=UPI001BE68DBD|nr:DUF6243 family protein [Streptomyces sp. ISL-100]MBT2400993.1 hypothetical protein [Streptomyces sp. ISL-100]